jgi:hypothetical protein
VLYYLLVFATYREAQIHSVLQLNLKHNNVTFALFREFPVYSYTESEACVQILKRLPWRIWWKEDKFTLCWIWGSHRGGCGEFCFLGYNAVYSGECQPTYQRYISPPYSGWKSNQVCKLLLKMEAIYSYKTSVDCHGTTWPCVSEDRILQNLPSIWRDVFSFLFILRWLRCVCAVINIAL